VRSSGTAHPRFIGTQTCLRGDAGGLDLTGLAAQLGDMPARAAAGVAGVGDPDLDQIGRLPRAACLRQHAKPLTRGLIELLVVERERRRQLRGVQGVAIHRCRGRSGHCGEGECDDRGRPRRPAGRGRGHQFLKNVPRNHGRRSSTMAIA
jgi:hypothetical protein